MAKVDIRSVRLGWIRVCQFVLALAIALSIVSSTAVAKIPDANWSGTVRVQTCDAPELSLPKQTEAAMAAVYIVRAGDGQGSGAAISPDGFVLTAAHVVGELAEVELENSEGVSYEAKVLRVDYFNDVALLKIKGNLKKAIACLNMVETSPSLGHDVFVLGNPGGEILAFSVSKGIVSSKRQLGGRDLLQIDASVNSGNSGGPLVDAFGRHSGVVSWKVAGETVEGLGFVVPAETAIDMLDIKFADSSQVSFEAGIGRRGEPDLEPMSDSNGKNARNRRKQRESSDTSLNGVARVVIESTDPKKTIALNRVTSVNRTMSMGVSFARKQYEELCVAPCDIVVDARNNQELFLTSPGSRRGPSFRLTGRGKQLHLKVNPGRPKLIVPSTLLRVSGVVFGIAGGSTSTLGLLFARGDGFDRFSGGMFGVGLATVATGITMTIVGHVLRKKSRIRVTKDSPNQI